jgi:uncharacterized MAPEG superfamily protein
MAEFVVPEFLVPYASTLIAYVCVGALHLAQAVVADVAAIRARHVPGMPITGGHDDFLFRAARAHANTNENLAAFVVLSLAAMLLGGGPRWTNGFAWGFVVARLAHMLAYYADLRLLRSAAFSVSFGCLVGFLIVAIVALA